MGEILEGIDGLIMVIVDVDLLIVAEGHGDIKLGLVVHLLGALTGVTAPLELGSNPMLLISSSECFVSAS